MYAAHHVLVSARLLAIMCGLFAWSATNPSSGPPGLVLGIGEEVVLFFVA